MMISQSRSIFFEKIIKITLWSFLVIFILILITLFSYFYSIKDCEVHYGNILKWGYRNETYVYNLVVPENIHDIKDPKYQLDNPYKYVKISYNNTTFIKNINETSNIEIIREIFPVEEDYIFTICESKISGISRRSFLNKVFFYKIAKII